MSKTELMNCHPMTSKPIPPLYFLCPGMAPPSFQALNPETWNLPVVDSVGWLTQTPFLIMLGSGDHRLQCWLINFKLILYSPDFSLLNVSSLSMTFSKYDFFRTELNVLGVVLTRVGQSSTISSLFIDICDYSLGQNSFLFFQSPYSTLYSYWDYCPLHFFKVWDVAKLHFSHPIPGLLLYSLRTVLYIFFPIKCHHPLILVYTGTEPDFYIFYFKI